MSTAWRTRTDTRILSTLQYTSQSSTVTSSAPARIAAAASLPVSKLDRRAAGLCVMRDSLPVKTA